MPIRQEATPCPAAPPVSANGGYRPRDSILSLNGDSTANIEFTTEFRASTKGTAYSRRPTGIGGGPKRRNTGFVFSIHEDEETKPIAPIAIAAAPARRSSILAQAPQRIRLSTKVAPTTDLVTDKDGDAGSLFNRSRSMISGKSTLELIHRNVSSGPGAEDKDKEIKKPARRGTIYIPSEDTTVPSIFMGVFSPIKNVSSNKDHCANKLSNPTVELTGLAAQMAQKKGPRKSLAALPPSRAPLQMPLRSIQETAIFEDIHGQNTGKENVPPGTSSKEKVPRCVMDDKDLFNVTDPLKSRRISAVPARVRRRSFIPAERRKTLVSLTADRDLQEKRRMRQSLMSGNDAPEVRRAARRPSLTPAAAPAVNVMSEKAPNQTGKKGYEQSYTRAPFEHRKSVSAPHKVLHPRIEQALQQYPLLEEDIVNPSMYEDNWLTHQEIAITQLVNNLFLSTKGFDTEVDLQSLRSQFLRLHQNPELPLLVKRLQAALLYGAMSIPKEYLSRNACQFDDIGKRRQFLDLWSTTYNLDVLRAAAEVVFGRQCLTTPRNSLEDSKPCNQNIKSPKKASKRSIEKFLDTFLIRNEDGNSDGSEGWAYRRTVLRSFLLILLLDQGRTSPITSFKGCLFQKDSRHKSSHSVLEAFANLLLPFVGDVARLLSYVNYFIRHVQYPLEEYDYHIENLAIDIRDGVRLTRLVEILLYPSASHLLKLSADGESTTTIAMPTGEVLPLTIGEHDWPLSQHLKFPCISRATKIFNVQLALSALCGVNGIGNVMGDLKAEDIVDGYREKTVALLWALVGKWGMGCLIDWGDVRGEINRLTRHSLVNEEDDYDTEDENRVRESPGAQRAQLKRWASAIAAAQGLVLRNFTTSFADGRIFGAIIDEYQSYLIGHHRQSLDGRSLKGKLVSVGCSLQFG
ncbi:putative calmodulin-binding protein sha1 [Phaeomoniella chlamydospora]|uniref:Putative calmodulin-binding protein sha1 n=1 Tax=Phaeomoniella chlamydospora TaxID=158046 RepID=A0A0G2EQ73_PHACM|nr:putative calmodulin-binding protein sha1 [Phaeomoniella chlamydospora]